MKHLHVIAVPYPMTAGEAWAEICVMGHLIDPSDDATWAVISCDGTECQSIEWADA